MKKTLLISTMLGLCLALAPAQAAAPARHSTDMWSSFYAGGFGGYGWTDGELAGGPTFDVNGTEYGAFAGYEIGTLIKWPVTLNGALEFHYGWSNADETRTVGLAAVQVEKDHEWGINFRPGLAFIFDRAEMNLKPYGILGYRRAEFDTTTAGVSNSEQYNGFDLGIGTELIAFNNFGTRLDYSHVFYQEKNGLDPDENDVRLGVVFHF